MMFAVAEVVHFLGEEDSVLVEPLVASFSERIPSHLFQCVKKELHREY